MTDRRIANRFVVQASLEEGKLGTLLAVHDEALDAPALLLVARPAAPDATLQAILDDNRRLAENPDVLLTYAAGHDEADGAAWLACEATPGQLLDETLKRRDRLELPLILRAGLALARSVEAMARAQVQHLDLSPQRVWVAGDSLAQGAPRSFGAGWWRLLPAYSTGAAAEAFYGNPEFLAAELCKGLPATPTTDAYGAATVLWALAAGKPPFSSSQPLMTLKRQAVEKPLRLDLVKPALKGVKEFQAALADALDKDPGKRPTAEQWRSALELLAGTWAPEAAAEDQALPAGRQRLFGGAAPAAAATAQLAGASQDAGDSTTQQLAVVVTPAVAVPAAVAVPVAAPAGGELRDRVVADAPVKISQAAIATAVERAGGAPVVVRPAIGASTQDDQPTRVVQAVVDDDDDEDSGETASIADGTDRGQGKDKGKRGKKGRKDRYTLVAGAAAAPVAKTSEPQRNEPARREPARPALPQAPVKSAAAEPAATAAKVEPKAAAAAPPSIIVKSATGVADNKSPRRAMTDRTLRVEMAESEFFDDEGAPRDLHEQAPPTAPAAKVGKGVWIGIAGFLLVMAGVAGWIWNQGQDAKAVLEAKTAKAAADQAAAEKAEAETAAATPVEPPAVAAEAPPPAVAPAAEPAPAVVPEVPAAAVDAAPVPGEPMPAEAVRAAELARLIEEGNALLGKDARAALAKADQALVLNAGHAPAARLKAEAQREVDKLVEQDKAKAAATEAAAAAEAAKASAEAAKASAEAAKASAEAEQAAKANAAAEKAAAERAARNDGAAAQKAAAAQAAKDRAAEAKAAQQAAQKAATDERAAAQKAAENERAAAQKATADQAAKARAAAQKAASAGAATEAAKAKAAAAEQAARDKAAANRAAAADKAAAAKAAAAEKAEKAAARPPVAVAKADPPAPTKPPPSDEASPAQQEASKMASLAQKANKAKLKVLYLQKAVKLDPGNSNYRNLLKIAEAELASESPQ